jgi:hypothetical protein
MNFTTESIAETSLNIELAKGVLAYNEGRISKFKLNKLYEAVINEAYTFFQKGTTAVIAIPKISRKHGVFLRRSA